MARRFQLITGLASALLATALFADDPSKPHPEAAARDGAPKEGAPRDRDPAPGATRPFKLGPKQQKEATKAGPEVQNVYKALEALTPEQQARFKENFVRWMNLSPDEKRAAREREETRKKKMAEETEAVLRESGLNLEPPQRAKFAKRYAEERRKLEEHLRSEMEEKRKPMVAEIVARLRTEFSGSGQVAATPPPR
jgi:hypothetical protein